MAEPNPTDSLWIGYHIPPEIAADLALPGGQAADTLHMTMAYVGKLADLSDDAGERALAAVAALSFMAQAVSLRLNGVARFEAGESSDGQDVLYATVDSEGLSYLRERLCESLWSVGLSPMSNHAYVPHVTLAYVEHDADSPTVALPNVDLMLDAITVTVGGESTVFELRGPAIWMAYADGEGHRRLFTEGAFAAPPEWMPLLPSPGSYKHPSYGALDLTRERLAAYAASVNDGTYLPKIPVNAEHTDDTDGALGWISEARQNENGSVDVRVEWTDRGREAIENDRFLYVSAEIIDGWQDATGGSHQNVVMGAALCTKPFFKPPYLRPLTAGDRPDGSRRLAATDPLVASPPPAAAGTTPLEVSMADDPKAGAGAAPVTATDPDAVKALSDRIAAVEAENLALKTAKESSDAAIRTLTEQNATMVKDARRKRFTDEVMGKSPESGAMWAGEVAKNVSVLEALADSQGEDSEIFKDFVTQQRATAEQIKKSGLFAEIGSSQSGAGASAWDRIEAEAKKVAADEKVSFNDAVGLVARRQPALYAEYQAEMRRAAKEV